MKATGAGSLGVRVVSWYWRWLLTCVAAVAVTGALGLGLAMLLVDDAPEEGEEAGPAPFGVLDHLAVYHVAEVPDQEHAAFLDAAGADVVHAPASCWLGLPERLGVPPDELVLGVWGPSADKLETAMQRVPGEPVFVAELENVCPTH